IRRGQCSKNAAFKEKGQPVASRCQWPAEGEGKGDILLLKSRMSPLCAVERLWSSAGANPARQLSLQPVAIGAVRAVTNLPEPSMERVVFRSHPASRQAVTGSERRAGLEKFDVR